VSHLPLKARETRYESAVAVLALASAVGGSAILVSLAQFLVSLVGARVPDIVLAVYVQPIVLVGLYLLLRNRYALGSISLRLTWRDAVVAALGWLAVLAFGNLYMQVLARTGVSLPSPQSDLVSFAGASPFRTALIIVGAAVLAPVSEELFFRGVIFGLIRKNTGFYLAAVLSSLVFSLFHGLELAFPVFVLAMLLCYLYERTGALFLPVLVHVVNNVASIVLAMGNR
jgi:membrane protease YdiL (CAAX protease family)